MRGLRNNQEGNLHVEVIGNLNLEIEELKQLLAAVSVITKTQKKSFSGSTTLWLIPLLSVVLTAATVVALLFLFGRAKK